MSTTTDDLKVLEKQVKKQKRIATEWAGHMHDLAEERLPASFEEIMPIAQSTYEACVAWKQAVDALAEATSEEEVVS